MKAFVDTSAWFAAVHPKDRHHEKAVELLSGNLELTISTFVLAETWRLLRSRMGFATAETFTNHVRSGAASIEPTLMAISNTLGACLVCSETSLSPSSTGPASL